MTPLVLGLGVPELLIILAVVLLLFGGARLAGLGKSTGRALREFKEETRALKAEEGQQQPPSPAPGTGTPAGTNYQQPPQANASQPPSGAVYQQPPQANASQPPSGAVYQQPTQGNQDPSATDSRNDV
jgi:sec-independent protein translocase protein TatA